MSAQLTSTKIYYAPLSSTVTSQVIYARYLDVSAFQQIDYYIPAGLTATISISSSDTSNPSAMVWTAVASSVAGAVRDRKASDKITALKIDRVSGGGTVEVMFGLGFSKGGVPPSALSGLIAYYEADQGVTLDGSNNVSQWNDLSGNGAHLTQVTALSRPGYSPASFGGKPAIVITSAGNQSMSASPTIAGGSPTHTMLAIVRANSNPVSVYNGIICVGSGSAGGQTSTIGSDNSGKLWFGGSGLGTPVANTTISGNYYALAKTTQNVAGVGNDTSFVNGVKQSVGVQPIPYNITAANTIYLGKYYSGSSAGNWDVAALAFFNRVLSDAEVQSMITYYNAKHKKVQDEAVILDNLTLSAWYKADAIPSIADGQLISAWPDSSGNNRTLTASGALRPTFYSSTSAQLKNGLPTVAFNGTNALSIASGVTGKPCTIFIVAKVTADVPNQYFVDGNLLNTAVVHRQSGLVKTYAGTVLSGSALANNTYAVICATFNSTSSAIRVGAVEATGDAGNIASSGITLGNSGGASAGVGLTGNIAEVIVASGTYSSTIKDIICNQLSSKWNI